MGDETDCESARLREINNEKQKPYDVQQQQPRPIQLKIHKNWKEHLRRRIYILTWLPNYDRNTLISDAIAGITLGLTMIPQSIAYAALAQLPSQYGLYSAFMGK